MTTSFHLQRSDANLPPWSWRWQRAWTLGRTRWGVWAGGLWLTLFVLATAGVSYQRSHGKLLDLESQLSQARVKGRPPAVAATSVVKDFAQGLGAPLRATEVVQELQRATAKAGVLLAGVQIKESAPSADQLGRLEVALTLRGDYVGTKQVLKQVLERFSNLTVQRMRMRHSPTANALETSLALSVWSAPLDAAAVVSTAQSVRAH